MSSREEMNSTYEQLKAAKAYLEVKRQDALQRMQAEAAIATSPPSLLPDSLLAGPESPGQTTSPGGLTSSPTTPLISTTLLAPASPSEVLSPSAMSASIEGSARAMGVMHETLDPQNDGLNPTLATELQRLATFGAGEGDPGGFEAWKANLVAKASAAAASAETIKINTLLGAQGSMEGQPSPGEAPKTYAQADSTRLAWTSAELKACREELNSAVHEACALRRSEAASLAAAEPLVGAAAAPEAMVGAAAPASSSPGEQSSLEASIRRVAVLEAQNLELRAGKEATAARLAVAEAELKARPFAPDSEFQERLMAKDRQLERLRAQADEVTKELELRQETLETMELRLRQAERALRIPATTTLSPVPTPGKVDSVDDARARIKMLYEQLEARESQAIAVTRGVASNGSIVRGRTDAPMAAKIVTSASTAAASSAAASREPSSGPTMPMASPSAASGATTPKPEEMTTAFESQQNGVPAGVRMLPAAPLVTIGEVRRVDVLQASGSSLLGSRTPVISEAQRLRHNVTELETLMTQIVGDKNRTTNSLERKIVELEGMVGANRSGTSSPWAPMATSADLAYRRLVGSQSSTSSLSPFVPARAAVEVRRTSSPGPGIARSASPTPSQGATRYVSPQSVWRSTMEPTVVTMAQPARRVASRTPPPQRPYAATVLSTGVDAGSGGYLPQAQLSPQRGRATSPTPVGQTSSPAPMRGGNTPLQPPRDITAPINIAPLPGRSTMDGSAP